MMHIDAEINTYFSDFFSAYPFSHLPSHLHPTLISKLRLCSFQPGEVIFSPRELPSLVHYIAQGRVRILGSISYQSPTLEIVEKGAVLGWDSLIRRVAVGSVRAATVSKADLLKSAQTTPQEILTIALPADDFEAIALEHLMAELTERVSLMELFDTLSRSLSRMPDRAAGINLMNVVHYIAQEQLAIAQHWYPGIHRNNETLPFSTDRVWLISGGDSPNLPIGMPISEITQLQTISASRFPIRLIGIDRTSLASTFLGKTSLKASNEPSPVLLPVLEPRSVPSFESQAGTVNDSQPSVVVLPKKFPIWKSTAPDAIEDIVACFGMICDRLQIPYRPDSLRRSLLQQPINKFASFDLYTRIAQAIGLNVQVVRFTSTPGGINRLTTPALIQYRNIPTVVHEIAPTTVVLGSPRTGLLRLSAVELINRLSAGDTVEDSDRSASFCQAIVLERFPTTPTKRFGFHWFLPMVFKQSGILVQVLFASIVIQLLGLANPLLVQQVIDNVIVSANAGAMSMFGILMVLFALLEGILTILRTYLLINTTNRMDLHLGVEIIRHLLHLPLTFFEKRPVGELSSRLLELENIRQFMTDTAITTVMDVVFSVFYIGVMFLYSARLTLCVLATVPIVIVSMLIMSTLQQKLIRVKAEQGSKVQSYLVEVLGGISSVKSQHMESLVEATWRDRYVQYLTSGFTTSTVNTIFYSYSQFLNTLSSLLVLWVGAEVVLKGELSLGGLIAFRILTGYVTGPLLRLARLWQRFQETSLSMDLLADIADSPIEEEISQSQVAMQLPDIVGHVQYHAVDFAFKPGQLQLSNVTLDIPAGTFVGIVGQSGSGKSTLMKLLPRLYTPQSGSISIDGYDISKVNLSSLRSQVGIVSQDAVLFQGTIRDNIALFQEYSDEDVIAAAKIADAHDFVMGLPEGYSTQVGERGTSLSGGQRQRIAIARVVMRNPRLLIFDEATSALDSDTERKVCHNLMQKFHNCTCFFITHRLNTIARADRILFMQSGVVAEQGTHQELMARRQLYYCLYAQQSREA